MKKVIKGAVYNTETAKKICEKTSIDFEPTSYGADVKKLQQLYRTKSGKYFFYIKRELRTWVVKMDDPDINPEELDIMLNPKHEELDVTKEEIIPIPFDLAMQFASEVYADADTDEEMKENILKFFPTLSGESPDPEVKLQKKIYLSEKACWYLDLMLEETKDTNSSFIEKLIIKEFKRKHAEGVFPVDPFPDETDKEDKNNG